MLEIIEPQPATATKTASNTIFVTAPTAVTIIPITGFPDTLVKSQNTNDNP